MTLNKFERLLWTISIRGTKSENLLKNRDKHTEIAQAYQREYDRRKKIFKEIEE